MKHPVTKVVHFIRSIVSRGKKRKKFDIRLRAIQRFSWRQHFGGFLGDICTSVDIHVGDWQKRQAAGNVTGHTMLNVVFLQVPDEMREFKVMLHGTTLLR